MSKRTLSRAELHGLVWTHPPREAARQLGVTAGELDRLFELMAVPYPWSGYWSSPGSATRRVPPLPRPPPGAADSVEITPVTPVRARPGKAARSSPTGPKVSKPDEQPIEKTAQAGMPAVPSRLSNPHRIIAARLAEEQKRRSEWRRLGLGGSSTAESAIVSRTSRIEDLLYKAVERRGHKVEVDRASLYQVRFVVAGRSITYGIRERYRQRREPLSREEALESWNVSMNRTHRQVRVMTGVLALTLDGGEWPRPQWEDKAGNPLEAQIDDIVAGLENAASQAGEREAQRRAEERRYYEEQQRREAARLQAVEEENRWRRLRELAGQVEEARQMRALLAIMESEIAGRAEPGEAGEFLVWARARLERFDPLERGAEGIIASVRSVTARSSSN